MIQSNNKSGGRKPGSIIFSFILLLSLQCPGTVHAQELIEYSIPAQSLSGALKEYASQSNMQILFRSTELPDIRTPSLEGNYTTSDAITHLLDKTGLEYIFGGNNTVVVRKKENTSMNNDDQGVAHDREKIILAQNTTDEASGPQGGRETAPDTAPRRTNNTGQSPGTLEEVIVTAQKRTQNLQDVPIAISTLSEEQLKNLQLYDSFDLANYTPGLTWGGTANKTRPQIFLRGVGNSDFQVGSTSPVAIYMDGIYQGSNFGLANLLMDLERVEVLKGPQGTLWGRNTTAGLINFVPNKADVAEQLNGYARVSYGEYDDVNVEGAIGIPLGSQFAGRLAVNYNSQGGIFDATGTTGFQDNSYGGWDWYAVRGSLAYESGERLKVVATIDYNEMDGTYGSNKSLGIIGDGCSNPGRLGTTCSDILGFVDSPDIHDVQPEAEAFEDTEGFGVNLQIDYDFGSVELTSVSAFSSANRQAFDDTDNSPSPFLENSYDDEYEAFSQELRLASNLAGPLNWIGGLYYYTNTLDYYIGATIRLFGPFGDQFRTQSVETDTFGVFGEFTYDLTDRLQATGGVRYTYDKRTVNRAMFGGFNIAFLTWNPKEYALNNIDPGGLSLNVRDQDKSFEEPSGRFSLVYKVNEDSNLWITAARGFKGGDPNSGAMTPADFNISEPEFVTSVEAGIKTRLLEDTLQIDLSGYYYDYTDKQVFTEVSTMTGNLNILGNAGELTITGIDARVRWLMTENLSVDFGFAYTDSEFDSFIDATGTDQSGNTTAYTPEIHSNTVIYYQWPLPDNMGTLSIQGDAVHTDDTFFTNDNNPHLVRDSLWLLGGNIGYTSADERWDIRLWVKNLTDEEYFTGGFDFTFLGPYFLYPGNPRIIGGTVGYRF